MENLLTPIQLSELLQVKLSTVYKWSHYGYVPHFKVGGNLRFDRNQITRWLNKKLIKGRNTYKLPIDLDT